ncbi:uncharacterized protein PHACADRAFT_186768 [Phanerochaete carnosa HHB-10118-sp]|uniref:GATA-type domain-containing protein n=1 Tax=Phanerochaete carnosa (strain HHB-10118-sp) TaxID=650164 RepID=K5W183_PHACS|nr:uncharacterized protein PHACADRAFT_186768 [Phanerochaete carnosa HHB-10118-sp]EKM52659.1 hypothetical protein PHACADRAFT_186768 [Phanerochaete carnosa HHB-10118-sp]
MSDHQLPPPPAQHGGASEIPMPQVDIKGVQPTAPPGQREEWHGRYPYPQPILPRWQPMGPQVPYLLPNFRGFGDEPRAQLLDTHIPQAQPSLLQTPPPEPHARTRMPEGSGVPMTTRAGLRLPALHAASSTSDPTEAKCTNCGVPVDGSQWRPGIVHHEVHCAPCGLQYATSKRRRPADRRDSIANADAASQEAPEQQLPPPPAQCCRCQTAIAMPSCQDSEGRWICYVCSRLENRWYEMQDEGGEWDAGR